MLSGLFPSAVRRVVMAALDRASADGAAALSASSGGRVVVIGRADVGRAVRERFPQLTVEVTRKPSEASSAPFAPGSLAALVAPEPAPSESLDALIGALADGGVAVLIGRGDRRRSAARALCAGLSCLEQRRAGRAHVTSGIRARF